MSSHPISDFRPFGPCVLDHLLTEEQCAFAIALGRILAEQWERQQQRLATGAMSFLGQTLHPEEGSGQETSSDGN